MPRLTGRDWQNDYAELAVSLKQQLARIADAGSRRKAIAEIHEILDSYTDVRDAGRRTKRG